jgi:hypothetical protein
VVEIAWKTIPWVRLLAETVAIVASILMAFSLDAAWSSHQESRQEALLSERLGEELDANLTSVENRARDLASLQAHAEEMVTLLESAYESEAAPIPDSLLASLFFNPEISSLETATAEGLQVTGRVSLFSDPTVSERLARWDARREAVGLREQELRTHFNDRLLPYLSGQTDIASFVANRDPYRAREVAPSERPWQRLSGVTEVHNTSLLRNMILERVLFLSATRIQVDMAARALQELRLTLSGPE